MTIRPTPAMKAEAHQLADAAMAQFGDTNSRADYLTYKVFLSGLENNNVVDSSSGTYSRDVVHIAVDTGMSVADVNVELLGIIHADGFTVV